MSRREFQLIEGAIRKFWCIELDGTAHTVRFGRIGTAGQSQTKEFATTDEAKTSHDKLIAEKLKKGYSEMVGATASSAGPSDGATAPPGPAQAEAASPPEPASAPPAAEAAPAAGSAARVIELDPDDWLWATWRPRSPRPRPEPPPFDLEDCLDRLAGVRRSAGAFYVDDWSKALRATIMSREEARFWIVAMSVANSVRLKDRPPTKLMDAVRSQSEAFSKPVTTEETAELIGQGYVGHVAFGLLTPGNFLAVAREIWGLEETPEEGGDDEVLAWFHRHVLPYLDDLEHRTMQDEVRASLRKTSPPPFYHYGRLPLAHYLAAALGLHEEVRRLVESIPDDFYVSEPYGDQRQRPQLLVLGLESPAAVDSETAPAETPTQES